MNAPRKLQRLVVYLATTALSTTATVSHAEFYSEDSVGLPDLQANAEDLGRTIVTPHLEQELPDSTNVVWCGTFQLAWNELREFAGGKLSLRPPSSQAEILSQQSVSKRDFDESSYVAAAGLVRSGIYPRIKRELFKKFGDQVSPNLLESFRGQSNDGLVTYSCLYKELPFRWSFNRFYDNLSFAGTEVDSFGIRHLGDGGKKHARMASQVSVLDYVSNDDLIVELRTESKRDRLLLAKIPAERTLAATVSTVQRRVALSKATPMQKGADLFVPVFDFDILRRYSELEGHRVASSVKSLNRQPLLFAAQSIRFRLDERGAVLRSEAVGGFGSIPDQNLIFDKPFLILLQQKRARNPYFALWVGNAELLVSRAEKPAQE